MKRILSYLSIVLLSASVACSDSSEMDKAYNSEIGRIKVSCNIRRRVKTHGKVISSHRKTTIVEASSIFAKDSLKNSFTIFSRQGIAAHSIEAATCP